MTRALLDTSVLIGAALQPIAGDLAISAVSLAELHLGVLVAAGDAVRAERLRRVGVIERTFDALPVDKPVAREYAKLAPRSSPRARRPRARVAALLIAATAAVHDATLWTRNPRDFVGLDGLVRVEVPSS